MTSATDNRTTELREKLTQRGVKWVAWEKECHLTPEGFFETRWDANGVRWSYLEIEGKATLSVVGRMEIELTPEQAIGTTLGVGECAQCAKDMGAYADSLCDPLKERINKLLRCLEHDWNISASWDGLRKFWCIELTEEGVKLRDAVHGTLTAEQVREAIEKRFDFDVWVPIERWQAIADELNAERHVETCENMREKFGYKRLFVCSECGVTFDPDCEINYCPWCGREVVD